jgi:hypothetical protein
MKLNLKHTAPVKKSSTVSYARRIEITTFWSISRTVRLRLATKGDCDTHIKAVANRPNISKWLVDKLIELAVVNESRSS